MNLGETGQHLFGHLFTFDSSDSPEKNTVLYCKGLGSYFLGRTGTSGTVLGRFLPIRVVIQGLRKRLALFLEVTGQGSLNGCTTVWNHRPGTTVWVRFGGIRNLFSF